MSRNAVLLTLLLCLCFLSQPFNHAFADDGTTTTPESEASTPVIEAAGTEAEESPPTETPDTQEATNETPEEIPADLVAPSTEDTVAPDPTEVDSEPVQVPETNDATTSESEQSPTPPETEESVQDESLAPTTTPAVTASSTPPATPTPTEQDTGTSSSATSTPADSPMPIAATTTSEQATSTEGMDVSASGGSGSDSDAQTNSESTTSDESADPEPVPASTTPEQSQDLNVDNVQNLPEPETASSTDGLTESEEEEVGGEFVSFVESDSHFSFSREECTRIEDGSFYCQKNQSADAVSDDLFAAPDKDGDLEIYLVRDGERFQITENTVDDASPYFDPSTDTIVWHRLINDRYQVISYDIESGEETQLTNTSVNNMEPARHDGYTVWQRWVEDNWEIILFDGNSEVQLTESSQHDLAPSIRGQLVIWNTQDNDGTQSLRSYDIKSQTYTSIEDSEGVSVHNPRMIVMYEAAYENGDVVMKGFDLVSGEIVPLHSLPRELPDDIPDSEPTPETRALIQQKPEPREAVASSSPTGIDTDPPEPDPTSTDTLDLRPATTTETVAANVEEQVPIPDLVIASTSEETEE